MRIFNNSLKSRLLTTLCGSSRAARIGLVETGVAGLLAMACPQMASALNLYDGSQIGSNLEVNLTTTVSYAGFWRVNSPSAFLAGPGDANKNDGDLGFQHGLVGSQFEALPVLDIKDGNYGAHVSGELYLNTSYLGTNQNSSFATLNPYSVAKPNDFTSGTRNINGQNARLLDAFVFARHEFDDGQILSLKVGRQTLLWGQSLFFAGNGISAGQAPIDIVTAENLPNPQAQQIFLPVGQVVLTYKAPFGTTFQGYYQFEYQHDVFEGAGSYFSSADVIDKGGQRLILGPGAYLSRLKDVTPPIENGQFGLSAQQRFGNYDLGIFGLRFDDKAPEVYANIGPGTVGFLNPTRGGAFIGNYQVAYPRDIQVYGASFSTTVGAANVAGEVSGRRNMPLVSENAGLVIVPVGQNSASSGAGYPIGSTWAAQVSAIYLSPGLPLDPGGVVILGEVAYNHVISVTANKAALEPGRQASAAAFEATITPLYNDVLPGLQVSFPIGLTYNFLGRSQIDQGMQHGTGSFTAGVSGTYKTNYIASLTYKDFLGKPDPNYNVLADRGYVSLNLQYTF